MATTTPNAVNHAGLADLASRYVDVASLPWTPTRFKGVEIKVLMEDKETGLLTALTRFAPGASCPTTSTSSSSRPSCCRARWPMEKVSPPPATTCGARPAAGTTRTLRTVAWRCPSSSSPTNSSTHGRLTGDDRDARSRSTSGHGPFARREHGHSPTAAFPPRLRPRRPARQPPCRGSAGRRRRRSSEDMARAAERWLGQARPPPAAARRSSIGANRLRESWHYVPRSRPGIPLRAMTPARPRRPGTCSARCSARAGLARCAASSRSRASSAS